MKYRFNVSTSTKDIADVERMAKAHLNYGWKYVSLSKNKIDDFSYLIVLDWDKPNVPDVPPFSDELFRFSAAQ